MYEAGRDGDQLYIALALIEGKSLAEAAAESRLPHRRGVEIVAESAEALAYAHGFGIVHRDVKPANIRLDAQGGVHLMDFGIAYRPDSGEAAAPPGTILGTPAYIAPEQAVGASGAAAPAGDQYSLARSSMSCSAAVPRSAGRRRTSCSTRSTMIPPTPARSTAASQGRWPRSAARRWPSAPSAATLHARRSPRI